MSHQTGIQANEGLKEFFAQEVKKSSIRSFKVNIENEELCFGGSREVVGTWDEDYDDSVLSLIEPKEPCYVFFRLDTKNNLGYEWLYITYSPDDSEVRKKMLYAGTRATMRRTFGDGQVKDEVFGVEKDDVTLEGYQRHLLSLDAPPPLTNAEQELVEMNKSDAKTEIHVNTRHTHMTGIHFPLTDEAFDKLEEFQRKEIIYVQLAIDVDKEIIDVTHAANLEIPELSSYVPPDHARYHVILFKHTHEGDYMESVVLVYSNPMYSCPVKERMLYSSAFAPLIEQLKAIEIDVEKRIEITEGSELTEKFIYEEIHPLKTIHKPKFAKPKPPGGRRMIKKAPSDTTTSQLTD